MNHESVYMNLVRCTGENITPKQRVWQKTSHQNRLLGVWRTVSFWCRGPSLVAGTILLDVDVKENDVYFFQEFGLSHQNKRSDFVCFFQTSFSTEKNDSVGWKKIGPNCRRTKFFPHEDWWHDLPKRAEVVSQPGDVVAIWYGLKVVEWFKMVRFLCLFGRKVPHLKLLLFLWLYHLASVKLTSWFARYLAQKWRRAISNAAGMSQRTRAKCPPQMEIHPPVTWRSLGFFNLWWNHGFRTKHAQMVCLFWKKYLGLEEVGGLETKLGRWQLLCGEIRAI